MFAAQVVYILVTKDCIDSVNPILGVFSRRELAEELRDAIVADHDGLFDENDFDIRNMIMDKGNL